MRIAAHRSTKQAFLLAISLAGVFLALGAAKASAEVRWELVSGANTTVAPGDGDINTAELNYHFVVKNRGDSPADGSGGDPILLSGTLAPGLTFVGPAGAVGPGLQLQLDCSGTPVGASSFSCQSTSSLGGPANDTAVLGVSVDPGASGILTSEFQVSGGGAAAPGTTADPTRIAASPPPFGIDALDMAIRSKSGTPFTQAGGHPHDYTTWIDFNTHTDPDPYYGEVTSIEPTRDVYVDLPPGLVGSPSGLGECTLAQLVNGDFAPAPKCPASSQVGTNTIRFNYGGGTFVAPTYPVFNMAPPPGSPARFGFNVFGVVVVFDAMLRSDSDYGITTAFVQIPQGLDFVGSTLTMWGVPGSSEHDSERSCSGQREPELSGATCPSGAAPVPFLRMPTDCNGGQALSFPLKIDSWFNPGALGPNGRPAPGDPRWASATAHTHQPPGYPYNPQDPTTPWGVPQGLTGCELVPVKGRLAAQTTALDVESPSGLEVEVEVPNPGMENPSGIASSDIKGVKVAFPQGLTINPSQAEGLGVCTPAQYASTELSFHEVSTGCPSDSKVGTVSVKTPLLDEVLPGDIYVAKPYENPFNSLLALYSVIEEPERGILIKLAGEVRTNETTGRIEAEFNDLPQQPFSTFTFKLREGARAPLVTPPTCGTYETEAVFTPWSDPSHKITSISSFEITRGIGGGPCPPNGTPGFKPGFSAGSVNNNAASFSPFLMRLTRQDGEQNMTRFDSVLPPGVLGKLAGVGKCPDSAIAAAKAKSGTEERANPSCPANSEIGSSIVGAGVGSVLTHIPGKLYLGGPLNGKPLSVIAITPALAGPFDVGTVVVRQALTLNPVTAEVEVDGGASDPIPHILKGIPAKIRDLRIYVDRDKFILNPTSCDPSSAKATLFGSAADVFSSADDVPVALSDRYQAANCLNLGFKPKLALNLKGGTKRGDFPGLRATLKARAKDANIAAAEVTLPRSAFLEQGHLKNICTRVQFRANDCPKASIYGHAKAITPLLDEPIEGPVLLRSSNHNLPDLVIALKGLVDVNVSSRIDSVKGGLRSTFEAVPDAPISKFVLRMKGGKKGLIVNSRNLCAGKNRAKVAFEGHNGRVANLRPELKPQCGKRGKGKR